MKSAEQTAMINGIHPLAGGAVMEIPPAAGPDPYTRLIELMMVVEELCPKWPERETFRDSTIFLL